MKYAFFISSRRRHTRWPRDWSSDVCSSDLPWIHVNDSSAPQTDDRHLQNPFAPATEEITAFDLPVSGALPANLEGRYLRIEIGRASCRERASKQLSATT